MYGLSKLEMGIAFLLLIYVLGNFETPHSIMYWFRTPFAGIFIFGMFIYLFYNAHVLITLLYVFSVYELLKRANIPIYDDAIEAEEDFKRMKENYTREFEGLEIEDDEGFEDDDEGFDDEDLDDEDLDEGFEGEDDLDEDEGFEGEDDDDLESNQIDRILATTDEGFEGEQQVYALNSVSGNSEQPADSEETEAFTQFLGKSSLENEMVTGMAPVGLGTKVRYLTSPYSSSVTNVTGASLV
jgi:hypothetical protein